MGRFLCAALALLAGCATLEPPVVSPPTQPLLTSFQIAGRISVRHGAEGFSGNLTWRHANAEDEFVILTPLGQGVARIIKNAAGVTLETSDQAIVRAPDAESLTQASLGFALPLSGLPHWVQAQPIGSQAQLRHNPDGTLDQLNEQGWQIDYLAYRAVGVLQLPGKVFMENAEVKLRLIVDEWQVPAP
ncbi:MAG: lipoprotein insertase outer membrane protein LolB [Burkholderiales bacterium]|nr:lipoprotein insertase outer membrane protein LolB [Burkholderiales bacterium]